MTLREAIEKLKRLGYQVHKVPGNDDLWLICSQGIFARDVDGDTAFDHLGVIEFAEPLPDAIQLSLFGERSALIERQRPQEGGYYAE